MKRIAFLGENPHFCSALLTTEEAYARSGNNVGNHAFWNAVNSHIENEKCYLNTWSFDVSYVKNNFDILVIPASNFIHPDRDMGALARKIERLQLPVLVIGLGAQATDIGSKIVLKEGTERFISVLNEYAVHITCRGEYTASVMESYGAEKISALGCPSNLTNLSTSLGKDIEKGFSEISKNLENINVILNIDSHRRKFFKEYRSLISLLNVGDYKVVCQNPVELVQLARGDKDIAQSPHIEFQKKLWLEAYQNSNFDDFCKNHFVTFFNANHWMEYSRKFDLSIGTRLHGNMLAFQAGVPSVFLSHDSRTSELTDIMKLPSCNLSDLSLTSKAEILEKIQFDGQLYDDNRKKIAIEYVDILEKSGLVVSQELKRFTSAN